MISQQLLKFVPQPARSLRTLTFKPQMKGAVIYHCKVSQLINLKMKVKSLQESLFLLFPLDTNLNIRFEIPGIVLTFKFIERPIFLGLI